MKNMVESSSASSSCCSSSNAAAMSLWQKYSDLQQEAERCRAEARSVRAKVDGLKQQMECLQQQQDRDASATVDAVQLTRTLRRQYTGEPPPAQGSAVDDEPAATDANRSSNALWIPEAGSSDGGRVLSLRAQWDAVETAYAAAVADGDRAVQAHALARAMRDEQRQERVAESRAFRQVQCPQWRLAAANVGLESGAFVTAALQSAHVAAAASDVICDTDGVSAVRQMITDDEEEASCCWMAVDTEEDAWDVNDPATWVIPDDDDELKEAVAAYKESTKARQAAAAELRDVWKPKEAALRENCRNREERTQQLQQQLARIDKDCSDLSSQLSQLQQLTVEDVALAQMYRTSEYCCMVC